MGGAKVEEQLKELGSKLTSLPSSKHSLLNLFKQAVTILSELEQSPSSSILDSMQPFLKAIVKPELLKHHDKDVKLLVASCLCQITRITAPEAPYSDDILKDVFGLIVDTLSGLSETTGPSFGRRVIILETLARYRSCVVMLDLECDDLINDLFRMFLTVARDDHAKNVLKSMETIMFVLLDESEDIREDLLLILLSTLGRNKKDVTEAARKLAMNVIDGCAAKLEPSVKQFLISSMSEDESSNSQIDYREIIYDLYHCSPQILSGVVPYLTGELLNDQTEARLRAVNLVGELFAVPASAISKAFQSIFVEFLKRLTDKVVEVRMTVLDYVKRCLLSNPARPESGQIFGSLCDRLLDYDENVRKQVVAVVCDVACRDLGSVPVETLKLVAERLRDKSLLVKKYTLDSLAEIYRLYCLRCKEGCAREYDWIPGKILRCFYDKDFRSDAIESVFCGALFPDEFAVRNIVEHWLSILAGLDKVEVKALEKILEQKQRLQQEMQKYLSLKQTYKDSDATDCQKKVVLLFRVMSRFFTDPAKAEEGFLALDQLKDANIWKILSGLLDPNTSFRQALTCQDDLLKILGEKHRLYDFLNVLSVKCSYILFSKEHVKEILSELANQKSAENTESSLSCINLLVILASYSPLLLIGSEEELLLLLKDDNEIVKEGILHVLARAGGTIREQLASSSSSVDLILERLCLEGTRRQAKYAIHALAAITKDDGLRSLSVLCKRLVDMMEEKAYLPTVLQSLGCIAQTAMAVYETRESEIVDFIKTKILQLRNDGPDKTKTRWRDRSELCLLKIFGIKTLVKSYLPVKDAHLRGGIDSLIEILRNMLSFGEISEELESSCVDKAHLKLASAKAVLRLSRYWENKIPVDVFYLALRTVEINYRQARKVLLSKVHQYIKDRVLDPKYACAFILDIFGSKHAEVDEDKHNLADVVQMCHQMRARQLSLQSDANSQLPYPEYILPYLLHALAHHPMCPIVDQCKDVKAFEPLYRVLYLFLSMVVNGDEDTVSESNNADKGKDVAAAAVVSILQSIKLSEDVVEPLKSKNSHAISELGLLVIKRLAQISGDFQGISVPISLPSSLFKPSDIKKEDTSEVGDALGWLTDDATAAHFESLALEVNGAVHLDILQDGVLEDMEVGHEMPLGKLIKRLKSQKNKSTIVLTGNSSTKMKNNVDNSNEVTDIKLGPSSKIQPSNGHDNSLISNVTSGEENQSKKRKVGDMNAAPIPKRRRSLSAHSRTKHSSSGKTPAKGSLKIPSSVQKENEPGQLDLVSPATKKRSAKRSKQSNEDESHEVEQTDDVDQKGAKLSKSNKRNRASHEESSAASLKKQKKRSISGLPKGTSEEGGDDAADLVDCRIKIWWPLDKRFYEGVVKSYDLEKKKHVVLYEDGDVEVLRLDKERWELVHDAHRPKNKAKTAKASSNAISRKGKSKLSRGYGQKDSDKSARGKGAEKNTVKSRKKVVQKRKSSTALEEVESESDTSNSGEIESSNVELESGDVKQDMVDDVSQSSASDVRDKSDTEGQEADRDSGGTDSEDKGEEANSTSEGVQQSGGEVDSPQGSDSSSPEAEKSNENSVESSQDGSDEVDNERIPNRLDASLPGDDAEDEPLSLWKQRVQKSHQTK